MQITYCNLKFLSSIKLFINETGPTIIVAKMDSKKTFIFSYFGLFGWEFFFMFYMFPLCCWFCFTKPFRCGDSLAISYSDFVQLLLKFGIWAQNEGTEGMIFQNIVDNLFLFLFEHVSIPVCPVKVLKRIIDGERFCDSHKQLRADAFIALLHPINLI